MIANVTRPNFFPGQLVDYKDFNRLSEQSDRMMALMCRYLYAGGGIIVEALDEFSIAPLKGLAVLLKPGMVLLPSGQPLVLSKELVVDLGPYVGGKNARLVVVSLASRIAGRDRYTDQEDSSISGYKTESFEPEVVISAGKPAPQGIELFRVYLAPDAKSLRVAKPEEEWEEPLVATNAVPTEAIVDLRHRCCIVPQTYMPASTKALIQIRSALYGIENAHRKVTKIYLFEDGFGSLQYLSQLHAEILSRPFQPLKVAFLLSEFADKLSLFLEALSHHVGRQRTNFDKKTLLNVVGILDQLKTRSVLPRRVQLDKLAIVSDQMSRLVRYAEEKFSLLNTIQESLSDLRDRLMEWDEQVTLAGHLFERVDKVLFEDKDSWSVKAKRTHVRKVATRYRNGDRLELKGSFLKEGTVFVEFDIPQSSQPLVVLFHQFIRRSGSMIHYEINGKHLQTDSWEESDLKNNWRNRGLIIPAEYLVPEKNRLKIRVEKSDLDFGFFDMAVYQAVVEGRRSV